MKKIQSFYTDNIEGEKVTTCRLQIAAKILHNFFHHFSKEKQCFQLPRAGNSGVKKKKKEKVLFIHMDLKSLNSTRVKVKGVSVRCNFP